MFALIAKQSPASLPALFSFIRLSICFACSIASSFRERKMFRSSVSGVAIFFEKCIRFSRAVSFPCWICRSLVFRVTNLSVVDCRLSVVEFVALLVRACLLFILCFGLFYLLV